MGRSIATGAGWLFSWLGLLCCVVAVLRVLVCFIECPFLMDLEVIKQLKAAGSIKPGSLLAPSSPGTRSSYLRVPLIFCVIWHHLS